jgi:SAM-dependent methyltransferase
VPASFRQQLRGALHIWWREQVREKSAASATSLLLRNLWSFVRDSTPERRRQRYGDMEYDWEHHVNTTSGTVGWRERLLGLLYSPYQPTDPSLFQEMMASLPIQFDQFTFVDLGSGKGRTLLMASEYPFRKIVGVEILPELHQIAQENLVQYKSKSQKCLTLEAICGNAVDFPFPAGPIVLYLFNPLPQSGLRRVMANLGQSLNIHPRPLYILYHNPISERELSRTEGLIKIGETQQYSIYSFQVQSS